MGDTLYEDIYGKDYRRVDVYGYHKRTIWKSSNGNIIKITDMTDIHLKNTIKFLERKIDGSASDDEYYDYIISMKKELERRNKMEKIKGVDLKVVGVTFKNDDGTSRKDKIIEMIGSESSHNITLEREPDNKFDCNAIKVLADGTQIGYIGKDYASMIANMMDLEFRSFTARIKGCGTYNNRPYCEITIDEV